MKYNSFNELVNYFNNSEVSEDEIYYKNLKKDIKFWFSHFMIKFFQEYKYDTVIKHINYSFDDITKILDEFVYELDKLYNYTKYIRKMNLNEEETNEIDKVIDFINYALRRVEILMYLIGIEISSNTLNLIETGNDLFIYNNVGLKLKDGSWDYDSCVKIFIKNIGYLFKLVDDNFIDNIID